MSPGKEASLPAQQHYWDRLSCCPIIHLARHLYFLPLWEFNELVFLGRALEA